jgi:nicotinate (nicotinamide) nucleotide adenylyltransferase
MKERIAIGGSAANPPHLGHLALINHLLEFGGFDKIIWIPSGNRKDKNNLISPDHRVAMTMLNFDLDWLYKKKSVFMINFQDVYGENQPTIYWMNEMQNQNPAAEIIWYTGVDSVVPQEHFGGKCEIEKKWFCGEELMREWTFCILPRIGYIHPLKLQLPSQFFILDGNLPNISSTDICRRISSGKPFEHLVSKEVNAYIKRFGLYGYE